MNLFHMRLCSVMYKIQNHASMRTGKIYLGTPAWRHFYSLMFLRYFITATCKKSLKLCIRSMRWQGDHIFTLDVFAFFRVANNLKKPAVKCKLIVQNLLPPNVSIKIYDRINLIRHATSY